MRPAFPPPDVVSAATMSSDSQFEQLVRDFYRPLYRFAYGLTRNEADAADLTQQTYCIWAEKGGQLRDVTKVKAWLFRTLHREYLQTRRRVVCFPKVPLDETADELPPVPARVAEAHDAGSVLTALSGLEPLFQEPLKLFYLGDLAYEDIAEVLEIPLGTVKSRLARGIQQLQARLAARMPAGTNSRTTQDDTRAG